MWMREERRVWLSSTKLDMEAYANDGLYILMNVRRTRKEKMKHEIDK